MTSKEELQKHIQLLNEIKARYPILNDTVKYLEQYQQSLFNPTLSECIKEWEEKGYKFEISEKGYVITGFLAGLKDKYISIRLQGKQYVWLSDETFLSYEEVHLLSKTLKALEVENG